MAKRDVVSFSAAFPDDSQWDEQGTEVVPGGQAIARAIRLQLCEQRISCSEIEQHCTYGWAFDAARENAKTWVLLAAAEGGWLIQLVPRRSLKSRPFGLAEPAVFETIQRTLHEILLGDKRFSGILWYAKADYDSCNGEGAYPSPH